MRVLSILLLLSATTVMAQSPGGPYLGQRPPGMEPEMFAPGVVCTGLDERDLLVHPEGRTIWYCVSARPLYTVFETRLVDDRWTDPMQAPFHTDRDFACFEPTLSADGQRVLFLTNRAAPGQEQGAGWANQNIFACRRQSDGSWSEAAAMPSPITSDDGEYFPCLVTDGTLYFSRDVAGVSGVWMSEPAGEGWSEPVKLAGAVNITDQVFNTYCAPDESWMVGCVAGHADNLGTADYWISFRDEHGAWLPAVNLGEPFNGPGQGARSVSLSPDGKYFFFSSSRVTVDQPAAHEPLTLSDLLAAHGEPGGGSMDIWWVDARVLERWRP